MLEWGESCVPSEGVCVAPLPPGELPTPKPARADRISGVQRGAPRPLMVPHRVLVTFWALPLNLRRIVSARTKFSNAKPLTLLLIFFLPLSLQPCEQLAL